MITSVKNYIITFIDKDGNEQIMDSKCYFDKTLDDKPLYVSLDNAKKALTRIKNYLKKEDVLNRFKHWHDVYCENKDNSEHALLYKEIYLNTLHINDNDFTFCFYNIFLMSHNFFFKAIRWQRKCKRAQRKLAFNLPSAAFLLQRYDFSS